MPSLCRVTHSQGNDQLLYFTSTSLLPDNSGLIFISDRTGDPNLFFLDFKSGAELQLTHNKQGILKSYVYFDGTPYRGFGKASVSLDAQRGRAYYIQGREIRVVDIAGRESTLAELPPSQMTAFTHVSSDGKRLCVPTVDARALDDGNPLPAGTPPYNIDLRVQLEGLSSYLRVYDTETGCEIETVPVPRAWVTHVQFSPVNPSLILFNHEWPHSDCGVRRCWLWDGKLQRSLRKEAASGGPPLASRDDWTCHEMWERDGSGIIYHGTYHDGLAYIGRVQPDGDNPMEVSLPPDWKLYGHFTVGEPGHLVSDGYYQTAETGAGWAGHWISLFDVDWDRRQVAWRPLAPHRSSWASQDVHPHPILDDACRNVYFTSDFEGRRAVYRLEI